MIEVLVYETEEDAMKNVLPYFDKNDAAHNTLSDRVSERERVYKEQSGFNERWSIENQKKRGALSPISPHMIGLPTAERDQVYEGAGEGLDLTACIALYVTDDGAGRMYQFEVGVMQPCEIVDLELYTNLKEMAREIKQQLGRAQGAYLGAAIHPVFYTWKEQHALLRPEDKEGLKEGLEMLVKEGMPDISEEEQNALKQTVEESLEGDPQVTGLSEHEIEEFKKAYCALTN